MIRDYDLLSDWRIRLISCCRVHQHHVHDLVLLSTIYFTLCTLIIILFSFFCCCLHSFFVVLAPLSNLSLLAPIHLVPPPTTLPHFLISSFPHSLTPPALCLPASLTPSFCSPAREQIICVVWPTKIKEMGNLNFTPHRLINTFTPPYTTGRKGVYDGESGVWR